MAHNTPKKRCRNKFGSFISKSLESVKNLIIFKKSQKIQESQFKKKTIKAKKKTLAQFFLNPAFLQPCLADHPNEPELAGVYKKNPNWSFQWTSQLGYTIRTLTDHSNEPGSWSIFFYHDTSWLNKLYGLKIKKLKEKQI